MGALAGAVPVTAWAFALTGLSADDLPIEVRADAGHELGALLLLMGVTLLAAGLVAGFLAAESPPSPGAKRLAGRGLLALLAVVPVAAGDRARLRAGRHRRAADDGVEAAHGPGLRHAEQHAGPADDDLLGARALLGGGVRHPRHDAVGRRGRGRLRDGAHALPHGRAGRAARPRLRAPDAGRPRLGGHGAVAARARRCGRGPPRTPRACACATAACRGTPSASASSRWSPSRSCSGSPRRSTGRGSCPPTRPRRCWPRAGWPGAARCARRLARGAAADADDRLRRPAGPRRPASRRSPTRRRWPTSPGPARRPSATRTGAAAPGFPACRGGRRAARPRPRARRGVGGLPARARRARGRRGDHAPRGGRAGRGGRDRRDRARPQPALRRAACSSSRPIEQVRGRLAAAEIALEQACACSPRAPRRGGAWAASSSTCSPTRRRRQRSFRAAYFLDPRNPDSTSDFLEASRAAGDPAPAAPPEPEPEP